MRNQKRFRTSRGYRKTFETELGHKLSGRQWKKRKKAHQRAVRQALKDKQG
jgi:hypothetical protein